MSESRESIVEYFRLPEQDIANLFWVLGGSLALILLAVLLRRWLTLREGKRQKQTTVFQPAEATAELARLSPNSADITVVRDAKGTDIEKPAGRAPLLKRDGALVQKKGRFYIGPPTGRKREGASALRGKGEIITLEFFQRGIRHYFEGRVASRKRLSRKARQISDVLLSECYEVIPVNPLQQEEQRDLMRHYLKAETGEDVDYCPYLDFRLYLNRTDLQLPDAGEMPGKVEELTLTPHRGSYVFDKPDAPETAISAVHQDLRGARKQEVWVTKIVDENQVVPLGCKTILGLKGRRSGKTLKLKYGKGKKRGGNPELEVGDRLLLGYAATEYDKECAGRVIRRRRGYCEVELEVLPREQGGYAAEVIEFSATGLRLGIDVDGLDYLLPDKEDTDDLDAVFEKLGDRAIALDFYPEFRFPPKAEDALPAVPGNFQIIGQVVRGMAEEKRGEKCLHLGVHFVYEPETFDADTGMPITWHLLHGSRESEIFLRIHQALNRLQAILHSDSPQVTRD